MTELAENLARVETSIVHACERAGRDRTDVTLVAVSKTYGSDMVREAVEAGLRHFGENRVEEAVWKIPAVSAQTSMPLTWHMIGHIQSRKARDVAPLFDVVHSVDSRKLAEKLAQAVPAGRRLPVLLEWNVSGEASKSGFDGAGWEANRNQFEARVADIKVILALPSLDVRGLMTMAPIVDDIGATRPVFRSLRRLRDALQDATGVALPDLSMGMTDDFPVAVEEGATMIRIGRALFGDRVAGAAG